MAIVLMTCMVVVIKVQWLIIIIRVQNYCDTQGNRYYKRTWVIMLLLVSHVQVCRQ